MMVTTHSLLEQYAPLIRALPQSDQLKKEDLLCPSFRLTAHDDIAVYYAPFDYVNTHAKITLLGVTPGWTQMEIACRTARDALAEGLTGEEVLLQVKLAAPFAGSMRRNLVQMLDELGMPELLGIPGSASLFDDEARLVHTSSAIRYPVFVRGENYTGHKPRVDQTPILRSFILARLAPELKAVGTSLIIPLGKAVEMALNLLIEEGALDAGRCLFGFPHPSGANGHRAKQFSTRKENLRRAVREWAQSFL